MWMWDDTLGEKSEKRILELLRLLTEQDANAAVRREAGEAIVREAAPAITSAFTKKDKQRVVSALILVEEALKQESNHFLSDLREQVTKARHAIRYT